MQKFRPMHIDIVVIGGGPTGIGAATRLAAHGKDNWLLIESDESLGMLRDYCNALVIKLMIYS